MDTKGPINSALKGDSFIFVIRVESTEFLVTKPTPPNDSETAADVLLKQWIIFHGPFKTIGQ